ncbi:hypothetical protein [Terracidiphilus gabretensis]|uniref:hypothetical protein n=1 Tax=Terracidiphilus gabretensis TaxID=1577687 RepID=UPI00071BA0C6|nr:hypothetical protein [Terracidiphilus gabretensis]
MNQLANKPGIRFMSALRVALRNRFSRATLAFLGLFILVSTTTLSAKAAGCNGLAGRDSIVKYPLQEHDGVVGPNSIVGLWHTVYTAGGANFGISFKEWHADGTESENVDHSAVIGNVCFGVWKEVGLRTVRLHHTGWTFDDNGNATGSFTIDETDVVAPNGMSYSGTFTFKLFDTNGYYISGTETTGTIAASRITVD